mgnify:CR=1 FL=1
MPLTSSQCLFSLVFLPFLIFLVASPDEALEPEAPEPAASEPVALEAEAADAVAALAVALEPS